VTDILLCSMPMGHVLSPSLGLGILKAALAELPYSTYIRYFSLAFVEQISYTTYKGISEWINSDDNLKELGEWLFSAAAFDRPPDQMGNYIEQILRRPDPALHRFYPPAPTWVVELALAVRKQVEPFLERCLVEVESHLPRLVGFSCTHQQKVASLALARRIKARWPDIFIIFGGGECEGIRGVELIRQFPFVDAVVSGPGELIFPDMVRCVMEGRPVTDRAGVYIRARPLPSSRKNSIPNALEPANLDSLPYPDLEDYFEQVKEHHLTFPTPPYLILETSRGCWWGQKTQCSFCSYVRTNPTYANKSPDRALAELAYFAEKHPGTFIFLADLVVCEDYFNNLFPALAKRRLNATLFFGIRSTIGRERFRLLQEAGVTIVQPGIESLDTGVLRLMHKGTTLFDNLQCLKWGKEYGLNVEWNLLYGFPGESPDAYQRMTELIPLISHLEPPNEMTLIKVTPYSPLFENASESGLVIKPAPVYSYIYPLDGMALENLSWYFIYDYPTPQAIEEYTRDLRSAVVEWRKAYPNNTLTMEDNGEKLSIHDRRPVAVQETIELCGLQRLLYLACDQARSLTYLKETVTDQIGMEILPQEIEHLLQRMVENYLMLREGGRFLSLAISDTQSYGPIPSAGNEARLG
jgi:ribosomal peptide maturation radical SAM protein 1